MSMLIKGARVIDPGHLDEQCDVLIRSGKIEAVRPAGHFTERSGVEVIDALGYGSPPASSTCMFIFANPAMNTRKPS